MANEDKATRYNRLLRSTSVAGAASSFLALGVLLVSGGSAAIRTWAASLVPSMVPLGVVVYAWTVTAFVELVQAPFAYRAGVTLERRYGLSTQTLLAWLGDWAKASVLNACVAGLGGLVVWLLLTWFPVYWWVPAAVCFAFGTVVLARLAPVLLLPLFYRFTPLERPELRDRLLSLASRAGARALGVFEWKLGDRTRKANAALTGLGGTVRILVSDTLLAEHSDEEIEVILAHELAHHVHRDVWVSLAWEAVLILVVCFLGDRVLTASVGALALGGKADVAGLPVLVLTGAIVSLVALPATNALSRMHERRADRFALALTRNVSAFVSAMRRLAAQNLSEERPSRLVEVFFLTHPSCADRIDAARAWEARELRLKLAKGL